MVDTLALRGQLGPALAPLLADPGVEKVLHGADNDILWLQVSGSGLDRRRQGAALTQGVLARVTFSLACN